MPSSFRPYRGLEDRASLHFRDLRIGDAEPAAAMPQHRVRLAQRFLDDATQLGPSECPAFARAACSLRRRAGRNSCSGGSSSRIVTGSPSIASKIPSKSARCIGQQLGERATASALVARHDHLAHRGDAVALEEHVLRAAQPDALGAEAARDARVVRRVGVRAHPEAAHVVGPAEQTRERADTPAPSVRPPRAANDLHDLARRRRQIAAIDAARRAVDRDPVAFGDRGVADA